MMKLHGLLIVLVLLLFAAGCAALPIAAPDTEPLPSLAITSFTYQYSGMRDGYSYTARIADGGTELELSLHYGDFEETIIVEEPVLEKLGEIAGKYRLDRWDGFDKTDRHALDGEMFQLSMTLADGTAVNAQGSNAFPQGYQQAKAEIDTLFEELIGSYSSFYPKTLASDELNSVYLMFTGEEGKDYRKFKVIAREQEDGSICLELDIKGYACLEPEEEYLFYGYCEAFPFEEIQSMIRKYDIPSWNGWERTAEDYENKEWFELDFSYASGEHICAMGTVYPKQYEEMRSELMELCITFIRENSAAFIPYTA